MTYKQALYFIGSCLSLSHYPERKSQVLKQIQNTKFNWEKIVKISSGHMVLPALYLNLKQADLFSYLPTDLVHYFKEITLLNSDRNTAILKQITAINAILTSQKIEPVFLKGAAHLVENLYQNIGERMIGDIDLLIAPSKIEQAVTLLTEKGYFLIDKLGSIDTKASKHYPRLIHKDAITAVEIHWAVVLPSHKTSLNYQTIFKDKLFINTFYVPSYKHQVLHNILNTQINDNGILYGKIMMRQMYDGFLLSFKPNVVETVKNYKYDFYKKAVYIKLIQKIFKTKNLYFKDTFLMNLMMRRYGLTIEFPKINRLVNSIIYLISRFLSYPKTLVKACFIKEARLSLYRRLRNPKWYGQHLRSYKIP